MVSSNYLSVKKWRLKNKDKRKEQSKRYFKKHKEEIYKRQKEWRMKNIEHVNKLGAENARKRRKSNPEKQRLRNLKHKQKREEQRELIAGRPRPEICELCSERSKQSYSNVYTVFDHNHKTGKFRGWICDRCNKVLGLVYDDKILLEKMIVYLKKGELI